MFQFPACVKDHSLMTSPQKKGTQGIDLGIGHKADSFLATKWFHRVDCQMNAIFSRNVRFLHVFGFNRVHADWWEDSSRKEQGQVLMVVSVPFPWFLHISSLIKEPSVAPHCHVLKYLICPWVWPWSFLSSYFAPHHHHHNSNTTRCVLCFSPGESERGLRLGQDQLWLS